MPEEFVQRATLIASFAGPMLPGLGTAHDLCDDGSLLLVPLPGHVRGQVGLLAEIERGPVLFAADGCWLTRAISERRPPHPLTRLFVDDGLAVQATIERLHAFPRPGPRLGSSPATVHKSVCGRWHMPTQMASLPLIVAHFVRARWRWRQLRGPVLERYQERRAWQIVRYVARHAPFNRAHRPGHDLREWRTFPLVDKRLMMDHFDTFNTRGIPREAAMEVALAAERNWDSRLTLAGLTVGLSSGTSGHRGLFLANCQEQAT